MAQLFHHPQSSNIATELRNSIYKYVFEDGDIKNLSLLLACRLTYQEAGLLAFSKTTFVAASDAHYKFLGHCEPLSDAQAASINEIAFTGVRAAQQGLRQLQSTRVCPAVVRIFDEGQIDVLWITLDNIDLHLKNVGGGHDRSALFHGLFDFEQHRLHSFAGLKELHFDTGSLEISWFLSSMRRAGMLGAGVLGGWKKERHAEVQYTSAEVVNGQRQWLEIKHGPTDSVIMHARYKRSPSGW